MFPYFDQIPRDRVAGSKGNAYIVCRDIPTLSPRRCSYSYQHWDASLSPQLCNGAYYGTLEIWSLLYKILSLTAIFPFQTETIQVALSLESRSEGKVDFKAYKNYFTAGSHWFIIIFLILVNIAAQVNKDICFGLRPQLDIYILFVLYLLFIIIVNMYFKRFMSKNWLTRRWDLGGWTWNQSGRPSGWNIRQVPTPQSWGRISSFSRKPQGLL